MIDKDHAMDRGERAGRIGMIAALRNKPTAGAADRRAALPNELLMENALESTVRQNATWGGAAVDRFRERRPPIG